MFLILIRENLNSPPELNTPKKTNTLLSMLMITARDMRICEIRKCGCLNYCEKTYKKWFTEAPLTYFRVISIYSPQIDAKLVFTLLMCYMVFFYTKGTFIRNSTIMKTKDSWLHRAVPSSLTKYSCCGYKFSREKVWDSRAGCPGLHSCPLNCPTTKNLFPKAH